MQKRLLSGLAATLLGSLLCGAVFSQAYPNKPIRIHTTGAGGSVDFAARLVAAELASTLGQPLIVENKPGSTLAAGVAKATPDGYTLLIWGPALWIGPLIEDMPYNTMRDFEFITTLTQSPNILLVNPSLPVKSVAEFITYAKARPGQLNYATGATGSSNHIGGELFKAMTGTNIVRVAYKGGSGEVSDLIAGQTHMTFGTGATWSPHIQSGKARALGTSGLKRSTLFPDLPAIAETVPGFVSESVLGMLAPAKTPEAIVRRLYQETTRILTRSDVQDRFFKVGQEAVGGSPDHLKGVIQAEIDRVNKLIKDGSLARGS